MTRELVLGPPGTGKTTALLAIVEEEMRNGTSPDRIGFVTFTRRAAEEAASRASTQFSLSRGELPWFRTTHSLCYRMLGLRPSDVLEKRTIRDFAVWAGIELTGRFVEDGSMAGYTVGDRILHMEHMARVSCRPLREVYDEDDDGLPWSEVERVSRFLGAYKAARRMVDYTDMLGEFVRQDLTAPLEVLCVDETQDNSLLQWRVVEQLARTARRVVYAGDDDQSIYRWAGASPEALVALDAPARVLGQSYRVPRAVQALAATLIGGVGRRRPKDWKSRDEEGIVDRVEDLSQVDIESSEALTEGEAVRDKVLILARNTFVLSEQVVPELRRRGIYFAWGNRGAADADVLTSIALWERLRSGGEVTVEEALNLYARMSPGLGYVRESRQLLAWPNREDRVSIDDLRSRGGLLTQEVWHEALDRLPRDEVSFILVARRRGEKIMGKPRVRVSTIHGSKGGEADHVILLTEQARRTHRETVRNPDDERRVFYVGCTRARQRLTIVGTRSQYHYNL